MLMPLSVMSDDAGNSGLMDAITKGAPSLNARLRYEHGELGALKDADAFTLRTRLGYSTAEFHGLRAFVEFEDVSVLGPSDRYNQAGLNPGASNRTIIADVDGTELNQAFVSYTGCDSEIKAGRQRIILGNARYVGNVGWRQNEQTYDAVGIKNETIDGLALYYAYVDTVYRIFGQENGTEPAGSAGNAARYDASSHLINLTYTPCQYASVTLYTYLLDLGKGATGADNSSDTRGGSLTMSGKTDGGIGLKCDLEYAKQQDNSATTDGVDYSADYYKADASGSLKGYGLGLGYEVLGSDSGRSFRTPLATAHKFNGWADLFLVTPDGGLRDAYAYLSGTCPLTGAKLKAFYHSFESDTGSVDYGREIDVVVARKICKNTKLVAKFADYDADNDPNNPKPSDVQRYSVQLDVAF